MAPDPVASLPAGFAQFSPAVAGAAFRPAAQPDVAGVALAGDPTAAFTATNRAMSLAGEAAGSGYLLIDLTSGADADGSPDLREALLSSIEANRAPVIRIALLGGLTSPARLALALVSHVVIARHDTVVRADWSDPSVRGAIARRLGSAGLESLSASIRILAAPALLSCGLVDDVVEDAMLAALAYVRKNRRRRNGELAVYRSREQSLHVGPDAMARLGAYWPFDAIPAPSLALDLAAE